MKWYVVLGITVGTGTHLSKTSAESIGREQVSTFLVFAVYYYLLPVATYLLMKEDVQYIAIL